MTEVVCEDCGWEGDMDELVDINNDNKFNQCPRCGSTNIEELDDDE